MERNLLSKKYVCFEETKHTFLMKKPQKGYGAIGESLKLSKIDAEWRIYLDLPSDTEISASVYFTTENKTAVYSEVLNIESICISLNGGAAVFAECPSKIESLSSFRIFFNIEQFKDKEEFMIDFHGKIRLYRKMKPYYSTLNDLDKYWNSSSAFAKVQNDTDLSDFTFVVEGEEFLVHKLILAKSSEVMAKMFKSGLDETITGQVEINTISSMVFKILLDFIYGNQKDFTRKFKKYPEIAIEVFKAAHQYQIKLLQNYCIHFITEHLTDTNHVLESYILCCYYKDDLECLHEYCWEVIQFDILKHFTTLKPLLPESIESLLKERHNHEIEMFKINEQLTKVLDDYSKEITTSTKK